MQPVVRRAVLTLQGVLRALCRKGFGPSGCFGGHVVLWVDHLFGRRLSVHGVLCVKSSFDRVGGAGLAGGAGELDGQPLHQDCVGEWKFGVQSQFAGMLADRGQ